MNKVITTDQYHRDDRLLAWADQVRASCVPMVFRTESNQGFRGEISSVNTGEVCVSRIAAVDHIAAHDWEEVRRTADDYLLVSIQVEGRGAIEQDARTAFVAPTDMVLFDSSRNFVWHFSGTHYTIRFPRKALQNLVPCGRQHTAVTIPAATGLRKIAADHIATLHRELSLDNGTVACRARLTDVTANLVALALADYFNTIALPNSNVKEMHLLRARTLIKDRIHEPELGPEQIADELGVSSRYLYRLFAEVGESIGEIICTTRLNGCAEWLQQRAFANRSITDIAMVWGFNNASHFSRTFRRHFGMSARDYRAKYRDAV
ncbi:helix-turn-helix domain-containing protein [bacterium M00.F.Ca.ET.228.01.1.1]|uniref:helix-turn-helix domain-containing protein n=1 Tax=Paraburkholderia phenoliruptrix TaxID=252970 RepID=UPI001092E9D7|nr:helix-turn-helix domain-containing protein [Paraburkholderia phenoliruptrix]TGP40100.1 helix-turn-helix domain-containing protein [bacterium M00.F.Ca.ET.228.01.1.1]TGR96075.1 helix-turn-helix domain-containing protein [bacterium M00.F.Ca.ET.191.01.1.1]TGT97212.1 helix-turn-helix domain-containing protein [bacterium M00.F.Ca.ET.155.01.1.1]MBW0448447.1 helix-turn-helix domain-containing protein [Paraburkholderia phenoliruptrix]MBW9100691.1 helix-turn-helix domain-containing protein [Paraburkh